MLPEHSTVVIYDFTEPPKFRAEVRVIKANRFVPSVAGAGSPLQDWYRLGVLTKGRWQIILVSGLKQFSLIVRYWDAHEKFLATNDPGQLAAFRNRSVVDIAGVRQKFETRPKLLRRLFGEA